MNNFDDIFDSHPPARDDSSFDKEAWAEKKQAERKRVFELADTTALAICSEGSKYQAFLDVQARFFRYTPTNALLIYAQMPQATQLRDFNGWREMGTPVRKGSSHLSILEPGNQYQRVDGSWGTYYNVKKVYDISQTSARNRGTPAPVPDDRSLLMALIHKSPVPIQTVDTLPNNMGALYDHNQSVIFVRRGMDAPSIFRSMSKELSHAQLAQLLPDYSRESAAFSAYCASYLLCRQYGIDASGYNFSRLPDSFIQSDPQTVRQILTDIRDAAFEVSARMNKALDQSKIPRGKEQER